MKKVLIKHSLKILKFCLCVCPCVCVYVFIFKYKIFMSAKHKNLRNWVQALSLQSEVIKNANPKLEGAKQPRIPVQSMKPKGAKQLIDVSAKPI